MSLFHFVSRANYLDPLSDWCTVFPAGLMSEVNFPYLLHDSEDKSFIEKLLAKDPNDRPKVDGIKNCPLMSDVGFDAAKVKGGRYHSGLGTEACTAGIKSKAEVNASKCLAQAKGQKTIFL